MTYKEIIRYEKAKYFHDYKDMLIHFVTQSNHWYIWRYIKTLRREERCLQLSKKYKLLYVGVIFFRVKKNILGRRLGFDIPGGCFAPGLLIWHPGAISVNPNARVGKDAVIVGNLCIGNVAGKDVAPQIGDSCSFGWDSAVIGEVELGNDCKVGAKALVNKSFCDGAILVGVPARNINV